MIRRKAEFPPEHNYPIDDWRLVERRFSERYVPQDETIFAVGNGYLGMRGNVDEGRPVGQTGMFVNGFYESWPIVYGEDAYGFAKTGQTMLNVPDGKIIRLYVDDEPLYLPTANLVHYERALNMAEGTLDRELTWETPSGKQILVRSRRLVSFEHRHLAAISYEVTVLNADAPVVIASEMVTDPSGAAGMQGSEDDPRLAKGFAHQVFVPSASFAQDGRLGLAYVTANSRMAIACCAQHLFESTCRSSIVSESSDFAAKVEFSIDAERGQPINLVKYLSYHTSRSEIPKELCARAERTLERATQQGFSDLLAGQKRYMDDFWHRSDVEVEGLAPRAQQCIRFNLFHILQAAGRAEGTGVPAKGLTGQAYEGHYFWDTEIYVLPFLIYTAPRIARNLLKFRHSLLDAARARARQVNQKGALFSWRTINGEEASAYFLASTAQYHINADIVYALKKYVEVTGDRDFLYRFGAEILVETARFWADLGSYPKGDAGTFHIHGVTGPDEYTAVVNDNTFTNLMARNNLRYAVEVIEALRGEQAGRFDTLVHDTGLEVTEIEAWRKAAARMYVPYDETLGVHPQDANFLEKDPWDFENTPADKYPLILFFHPLVIYRHQVIKQADVALAMFLLGGEFTSEQKKRNFDYYDPLTTGDSSLSACIESIVAWDLGYEEKAEDYLRYAALMDLADVGGNVKDGVHVASLGGTWMGLIYGVAGMRDDGGRISFHPHRFKDGRMRFPLTIRGQELEVRIDSETVTYRLRKGSGLVIEHQGEEVRLAEGKAVTRSLSTHDSMGD